MFVVVVVSEVWGCSEMWREVSVVDLIGGHSPLLNDTNFEVLGFLMVVSGVSFVSSGFLRGVEGVKVEVSDCCGESEKGAEEAEVEGAMPESKGRLLN
jgi:hypothetical protein